MQHFSLSGTDDSLFTSTIAALQREQDMSICHDMSAQKTRVKSTLYESESLLRHIKITNHPDSFICFHSRLRKIFEYTFILAHKALTCNIFTINSIVVPFERQTH